MGKSTINGHFQWLCQPLPELITTFVAGGQGHFHDISPGWELLGDKFHGQHGTHLGRSALRWPKDWGFRAGGRSVDHRTTIWLWINTYAYHF